MGIAATFSKFCNWRIDFAYADTDNSTHVNGKLRAVQCHFITK